MNFDFKTTAMNFNSLLLFIFLLSFNSTLNAQIDTSASNKLFYQRSFANIPFWLTSNNIPDSLLIFKEYRLNNHGLKAYFKTKNKANWDHLDKECYERTGKYFSEILFQRIVFACDLTQSQVSIEIEGEDVVVFINHTDNLQVDFMHKMGPLSDEYIIPIGEMDKISQLDSLVLLGRIDDIASNIQSSVDMWFGEHQALVEKYELKMLSVKSNEIIFIVNNVVDLVLDEGYFEHLKIIITFSKSSEGLTINYWIMGKYGAGILWAPKNSDYYDMEPKYSEELKDFSLEFKSHLHNTLKQTK